MWVTIWYGIVLLIIIFFFAVSGYALYLRRIRLNIKVYNHHGKPVKGIVVYGIYNSVSHIKTFAGTYGGQTVISSEPQSDAVRKKAGVTDENGKISRTFWFYHFYALQIMKDGEIVLEKFLRHHPNERAFVHDITFYLPE